MPTESFEVFTILPTTPEELYAAWLDSQVHAAFTGGGAADIDPSVGGKFTAWDGYIAGTNKELEPGKRILQQWRTTEFGESDEDSLLEVVLEPHDVGTRLTLRHSNIPEGQGKSYEQGWHDHYFIPMAAYYGEAVAREEAPPKSKAAPKKPKASKKKPAIKAKAAARPAKKTRRAPEAKSTAKASKKKPAARGKKRAAHKGR